MQLEAVSSPAGLQKQKEKPSSDCITETLWLQGLAVICDTDFDAPHLLVPGEINHQYTDTSVLYMRQLLLLTRESMYWVGQTKSYIKL